MASTSEKGHAKNIANLNLLNANILALGTLYNPSNPKLLLSNLQNLYNLAFAQQQAVNTALAPYSLAVDNREIIFKPLSKQITKLRKAYKATEGVTQVQLEDFMTVARKVKGIRKTMVTSVANNPDEPQTQHSVAQLSYDQRTNNMDLLISLLQNTPNYSPNEPEYQIGAYQSQKQQMLQATQGVTDTFIPLNSARGVRNNTMYNATENLVDTANRAKDYLFAILDSNAVQYKTISRIKFKKV